MRKISCIPGELGVGPFPSVPWAYSRASRAARQSTIRRPEVITRRKEAERRWSNIIAPYGLQRFFCHTISVAVAPFRTDHALAPRWARTLRARNTDNIHQ